MPDDIKPADATIRTIRFDPTATGDAEPRTTTKLWYGTAESSFKSGFWAAKPGKSEISYTMDELCVLIEGEVRLTDASGRVETYKAGDTFLIPKGFKGTWETVTPVRKFFAVHKPA